MIEQGYTTLGLGGQLGNLAQKSVESGTAEPGKRQEDEERMLEEATEGCQRQRRLWEDAAMLTCDDRR